ncbi:uncharacterized protein involved in formation of periplasmic nitrate reductase [Hahella chejuensis KCTC 2396]|uniref:Chaperone NapD n=1 Tax=Hahella chejuensis (strain KCTC 2396) TaxID=349521 RepID=Q2SGV8_HAHCH|nr:chaperone NapD [Hahella chejuensis]ABC30116.1 uncharacterized protein involved in formation of periplasmic nitrate reductase [Hahella chejuensis KCTC 2396]
MEQDEHIVSFLIQCAPQRVTFLSQQLHQPPTQEVTHSEHVGKIVVVMATTCRETVSNFLNDTPHLAGVYSVNLIYHHCERASELDRNMS